MGAKYRLDDNFERVGYTDSPIAIAPFCFSTRDGDELVNDPAPVLGPDSVFAVTRMVTPLSRDARTILRVRELSYDLEMKGSEFDLDISSAADGEARQNSLIHYNGYFYLVIPTTVGKVTMNVDLAVPSDLIMVKFDQNWKIVESKVISADPHYTETYVTGFKIDGNHFYITR